MDKFIKQLQFNVALFKMIDLITNFTRVLSRRRQRAWRRVYLREFFSRLA